MEKRLFTSESVSEGHPDKVADQISDAILDAMLEQDPNARVACETTVTTGLVLVVGEISTTAYVDITGVVRQTILDIGYDRPELGFDGRNCAVLVDIDEQSQISLQESMTHSKFVILVTKIHWTKLVPGIKA